MANDVAADSAPPVTFWRAVFSLWDTLLLSILLGLVISFISGKLGTGLPVWTVFVCVALAYGKLRSGGNSQKSALAGVFGAQLAIVVNNVKPHVGPVGGVSADQMIALARMAAYPILGWTVIDLEHRRLGIVAKAWNWLVPVVLIPGTVVWLVTGDLRQALAELIFTTGCALIVYFKKAGTQAPAQAGPAPASAR